MIRRLTLLGLGLLGGSVAKAARADGLAREIVAVGRRRESLEPALQDGTVDHITLDVAEGVAGADLCMLATPVATLTELLPAVWRAAAADVVITDVGSTKAGIVRAADALSGARPLAFVAAWGPRFTVGNRRPNIPGPAYPITGLSESVTFSLAPHLGSAPTIPVIFGNLIGVGLSNSSRDFDRGFV